jgi:type IV secretory pathway VirB6-like protein
MHRQISEYSMKFSAKVTSASVDAASTASVLKGDVDSSSYGFASSKWSGAISTKASNSMGSSASEHSFTMSVTAVQADMPTGIARVLSILQDAILHDDDS